MVRRMLNIAERKRFISFNPFREIQMLEERKQRRQAHILTPAEEERLLKVSPEHLRVLIIPIVNAGLRSGKEALSLKWMDVDFTTRTIQITQSKTLAGRRVVYMNDRCFSALKSWHDRMGSTFSEFVFTNPAKPDRSLKSVRASWPTAFKAAGWQFFWIYDLRHTFASRLSGTGASPLQIAHAIGHANVGIVTTYARPIDEFQRVAIGRLDALFAESSVGGSIKPEQTTP